MEILLRLLGVLQNVLCLVLDPVFWVLSKTQIVVLQQPIRKPILSLSATQLAKKIRTGELSCEEVVHTYFFRSKRVNMKLNAIVEDRYAKALQEAEKVDEFIASKKKTIEEIEKETPLLGVPISVGECCKLKGMSYSVGCELRSGKRADDNGKAVEMLLNAGAIPMSVTNQPELCLSTETYNLVSGLTRNPYSPHHTAGGSAGGEAALVGSAGSVVGVASDFIGSLRCPAMFNGIFGHRPTPKCVPVEGHYPGGNCKDLADYLVIGPLTRYAEDLPLMLKLMAGDEATKLKLDQQVDLKSLKIYFITEVNSLGLPYVGNEIQLAIKKAADYFNTSHNCDIKKVYFDEMHDCPELSEAVLLKNENLPDIFNEAIPENPKEYPQLLTEILKSCVGLSSFSLAALQYNVKKLTNSLIPERNVSYYVRKHETLKKRITDTLGENGVLLFPTYPTSAHYHYQSLIRTNGVSYCSIITSLGLPATNIPMGLDKSGLPIGFQVVAAPYQDRLCFAVAKELEKAFGGWVHPPCLETPRAM